MTMNLYLYLTYFINNTHTLTASVLLNNVISELNGTEVLYFYLSHIRRKLMVISESVPACSIVYVHVTEIKLLSTFNSSTKTGLD